jgi:hypothetical protein
MLFSCKTESALNLNLKDLANVIVGKIDLPEDDTLEYSADQIQTFYGISDDNAVQIVVIKKLDVSNISNAEVLILVEAKDKDKAKEIENNLKEYKTYTLNGLMNYNANPDNERQYYIVEGADIIVNQQYVFWAVFPETKAVGDIIDEYIKNSK